MRGSTGWAHCEACLQGPAPLPTPHPRTRTRTRREKRGPPAVHHTYTHPSPESTPWPPLSLCSPRRPAPVRRGQGNGGAVALGIHRHGWSLACVVHLPCVLCCLGRSGCTAWQPTRRGARSSVMATGSAAMGELADPEARRRCSPSSQRRSAASDCSSVRLLQPAWAGCRRLLMPACPSASSPLWGHLYLALRLIRVLSDWCVT